MIYLVLVFKLHLTRVKRARVRLVFKLVLWLYPVLGLSLSLGLGLVLEVGLGITLELGIHLRISFRIKIRLESLIVIDS